jgi:hypothetical protein
MDNIRFGITMNMISPAIIINSDLIISFMIISELEINKIPSTTTDSSYNNLNSNL